jgi:DHA2 family lincomycin resistance protein-like MFS transporter
MGTDVAGARAAFVVAAILATVALPLTFLVGAGKKDVEAASTTGK